MAHFELAQLNIAVARYPLHSPFMAGFVDNLERINALAEASPGFLWRLPDDGSVTSLQLLGDDTLVNLTVWRDLDALRDYVYRSEHADFIRRRKEWFERLAEAFVVLWWVPQGRRPTVAEAVERLARLRRHGPMPEAFTFRRVFPPPEAA